MYPDDRELCPPLPRNMMNCKMPPLSISTLFPEYIEENAAWSWPDSGVSPSCTNTNQSPNNSCLADTIPSGTIREMMMYGKRNNRGPKVWRWTNVEVISRKLTAMQGTTRCIHSHLWCGHMIWYYLLLGTNPESEVIYETMALCPTILEVFNCESS